MKRWPDAMLWLTPASLWYFVLSLNPGAFSRQPDGKTKIEMDLKSLVDHVGESMSAGTQTLREAGMAEDAVDRVFDQGLANIKRMIGPRTFLEDYNVLHPKDGKPFIYQDVP